MLPCISAVPVLVLAEAAATSAYLGIVWRLCVGGSGWLGNQPHRYCCTYGPPSGKGPTSERAEGREVVVMMMKRGEVLGVGAVWQFWLKRRVPRTEAEIRQSFPEMGEVVQADRLPTVSVHHTSQRWF